MLSSGERALIARAAGWLVLTRVGLWLLPLGTLRRLLHATSTEHGTERDVRAIAWAVTAAGRRIPWSTCLVEALAADRLLRQAGLAPELRIGMRRGARGERPIEAHAWVMVDDRVVVGNDHTLDQYVVLTPGGATS